HDRDHPRHVEALLAAGEAAAQHEVADVGRVELGHLGQGGGDHLAGQVVGPDGGEGTLERPADWRAGGGDDDGLGHWALPAWTWLTAKQPMPARPAIPALVSRP